MTASARSLRFLRTLRNRTSIRTQTALLAGLLCVAAVALAAVGAAAVARQEAVGAVQRDLATLARTMADRLDQDMFERYREIGNLAGLEPLRSAWSDSPDTVRTILEQLQATLPEYAWIGLARPDGTVAAATGGLLEGASVATRPWFLEGLEGASVRDVHDALLLDSLLRTSAEQAPFRFVDVAAPVYGTGGEPAGVVGAHLSWTWADGVRGSILSRQAAPADTELLVLARDGVLLMGAGEAPPQESAAAAGESGQADVFVDREGAVPMLTALVPTAGQGDYPGLGWVVAARRPLAAAEAPADALVLRIAAIGGLVAIIAAVLAWVVAGTVTRPLTGLARDLDRIGREPTAKGVGRQGGSRDILLLSTVLRSLLRRVGTAEAGAEAAAATAADLRQAMEAQARAAEEETRRLGSDLEELRALAETDPLTGLLNRRAFLPAAAAAMELYESSGTAVCILMLDIDHFKRVNDTRGHAAGDEVIRTVGRVIASQVRAADRAARFGGEEFVVLLRDTDETGALRLAERIREQVAATGVLHQGASVTVTVSGGLALAEKYDRDIEDVVQRADTALYAAKAAGRNRVVMSDQDGWRPAAVA